MEDDDLPFELDPDSYQMNTRSTLGLIPSVKEINNEDISNLQSILVRWNSNHTKPDFEPLSTLLPVAELVEKSTEEFLKSDPDPLDDRHPVRTHPHSSFGNLLKILFRNEEFMNKLVVSYLLCRDNIALNAAAARVLLDCVPGLDSSAVFSEPEDFVPQLYTWAEKSESDVLKAYSMGLLASAMEVQEHASKYREQNAKLIPIALARLQKLKDEMFAAREREREAIATSHSKDLSGDMNVADADDGPFANITMSSDPVIVANGEQIENSNKRSLNKSTNTETEKTANTEYLDPRPRSASIRIRPTAVSTDFITPSDSPPRKRRKSSKIDRQKVTPPPIFNTFDDGHSNSNWHLIQPMLIGVHKIHPLSVEMHQRLILQYLGPTGEYQDLLAKAYEGNAMDTIWDYLDLKKTRDVRMTFDATRYVSSLLVHRKFAMEFVQKGGVEALLKIPCSCLSAVGVVTCLYYLSYTDDVMERVCQLSEKVVDGVVEYALWCMEHSHESGMASAAMFFTHGFRFKAVLEKFDQKDGLRKLYNYLSTLSLMQDKDDEDIFQLSEEQMHTSTQTVRNACAAFRRYALSHLFLKLEQLKKCGKSAIPHGYGCSFPAAILQNTPCFRPMILEEEDLVNGVWTVACAMRGTGSSATWRVGDELRKMGVVRMMFSVVLNACKWEQASGRNEMARNALDVLWILSAIPKTQLEFNVLLNVKHHQGCSSLNHIVDICGGDDNYDRSEMAWVAMNILIVLVCTPPISELKITTTTTPSKPGIDRKIKIVQPRDILEKMWENVRASNGIMTLTKMVQLTGSPFPLTDVDRLRATACKALLGLARCPDVRQILSKMPLVIGNELHNLMREPILGDRRTEHQKFCRDARKLIELVTGKPARDPKDMSQEKLWRQFVVNSTKITYSDTELLQLIREHLVKKGLQESANQLAKEANLPSVPACLVPRTPARIKPLPRLRPVFTCVPSKPTFATTETSQIAIDSKSSFGKRVEPSANLPTFATPTRPATKSRSTSFPSRLSLRNPSSASFLEKSKEGSSSITHKSLDDIITQNFRVQHSECRNPVTTCPPFSLFKQHQCPDNMYHKILPEHVITRTFNRPIFSYQHRHQLWTRDERFTFSRFRPFKTFLEHEEMYTAASFSIDDEHIIVGMYTGDVHWLNVETSLEESHTQCHHSAITHIEPSRDGSMLLTSSAFMAPFSSLWRLGELQEHLLDFSNESHVSFANRTLDKIIGTGTGADSMATVFDTETGQPVVKCYQEGLKSRYARNKAQFSPDDSLVMSEGHLWDVRAGAKIVHSFDQLNAVTSGVFHPHGNEVIINSEVWDVRTFRLIYSIPALDQTQLAFNTTGNIMYALKRNEKMNDDAFRDTFKSSFRTFDSSTYQALSTVDVKKNLLGLCADHADNYMAVIEKTSASSDLDGIVNQDSSAVKMYEVGKVRVAEDDADEGDDDGDGDEHESDDNSDDSLSDSSDSEITGDEDGLEHIFGRSSDDSDSNVSDAGTNGSLGVPAVIYDDGSDHSDESEGWELAEDQDDASRSVADVDGDANESDSNNSAEEGIESGSSGNSDEDDLSNEMDDIDDDDEDDVTFSMEDDSRGQGSSSIVLNPHLRRARQRGTSERDGTDRQQ